MTTAAKTAAMEPVVKGLATTSDKIRALDAAGYQRADIARFLGKKYQHVRNVLVKGPPKSQVRRDAAANGKPGDVEPQPVRMARDGRLVIPADMRAAMLMDDSGMVTAEVVEGELRVVTIDVAVYKLQEMFRGTVPPGVSAVDEFIAERRAEAAREEGA